MIELQWGNDRVNPEFHAALVSYVSQKIGGGDRGFGQCQVLGVFEDSQFLGAIVFHNYEPSAQAIEISAAAESRRWLNRKSLSRIFGYCFDDIGCQVVVARISENNKPLHRIFQAYGFNSFVIPRLRGRNEDERVFTLTDDDWRSGKFNKEH